MEKTQKQLRFEERRRTNSKAYYHRNVVRVREVCRAKAAKVKVEKPSVYLWRLARQRAREKGIEFSITADHLVIPEFCPVLGLRLEAQTGVTEDWGLAPSVDRKDPTKGYVPGNVFVISRRANVLKGNGSAEEHLMIANWMTT